MNGTAYNMTTLDIADGEVFQTGPRRQKVLEAMIGEGEGFKDEGFDRIGQEEGRMKAHRRCIWLVEASDLDELDVSQKTSPPTRSVDGKGPATEHHRADPSG